MTDALRLDTLPSDVLILIFDYCHAFDLVRLSEVCTRFYDVIRGDTLWIKKSKQPLVTNQASKKFCERCNPLLCVRTKWHVSQNWQCGRYEKKVLFSQKIKLMPWIQLTGDMLWWSGGNKLCGFKRIEPFRESNRTFVGHSTRGDICKFIVRDQCIITGHRNGSIKFWNQLEGDDDRYNFNIKRAHANDVNAIDEISQTVISGSGNGTVKVWRTPTNKSYNMPLTTVYIHDRVWSLAANPMGNKFAVGSAGNGDGPPLRIFDLECYNASDSVKHNWRRGAGILDMVWENPHTLLTCGYDTYIRKWDMRTGTCVNAWPDPTDATLYCISTDYHYTMVSGTQFNCKAVLWDQRQKNFIQLYFMNLNRMSSPVYCLAFDSTHLYGATDQHLVELTFSGYSYKENNCREILRYERVRTNWSSANCIV